MEDRELTHEESLKLINQMIGKAKNSIHDNGLSPILWGTVISICSLVTFLEIKSVVKLPFSIWILTAVAIVPQIILSVKESKNPVKSYDDVAMSYIWTVFGIGIAVFVFITYNIFQGIAPAQAELRNLNASVNFKFSEYTSSLYLLWYGWPGMVTGGIKKFKAMLWGGILCWVFAIIALYTTTDVDMLLVCAGAVAAWLIPGIILRRIYNRQRNV